MKTRKLNKEVVELQVSECCTSTTVNNEISDPCCEQPTNDSSCCDKSETREVNAEKTGCC